MIGETDFTSGPSTLHPKAIYLVEGRLFQVESLDYEGRKAYVRGVDCDYYTTAITYSKVTVLERLTADGEVPAHGDVHVSSRVVGFKKIKFYTNENVGSGELDLPEQQMHTTAYWLTVPPAVMQALPWSKDDKRDGVVGLGFAMKSIATLLLMCDGRDLGLAFGQGDEAQGDTRSTGGRPALPDQLADEPRLYLYDAFPGGIGFSVPLYGMHHDLLDRTRELIAGCGCEHGCPTCVGPIGETGPSRQGGGAGAAGGAGSRRRATARLARPADAAEASAPAEPWRRRTCRSDEPEAVARRASAGRRRRTAAGRAAGRTSASRTRSPAQAGERRARPPRGGGAGRRVQEAIGGRCIVVDREYRAEDRHGRHAVASIVRTLQASTEGFATLGRAWPGTRGVTPAAGPLLQDLDGLCVVDLETTGLAGGAGTQAFLVGCARIDGDGIAVRQFLSPGFEHERAQLHLVEEWMRDRTQLLTFNGRTFDVPLLEMRFNYHRLAWPWGDAAAPRRAAPGPPAVARSLRGRRARPRRGELLRWRCSNGG